ncbi:MULTISPECIES: glycosyltransferase [Deefgea]|uniref:Glycosyltransferase n=1 Tax=Deefgea chitinilytica TaxID=570276 RepID=A0ABS2CDZ3_9NEIS|nr:MULTISPECIES: glycosyltransferase [Deefgea]MBM5572351.1 glycosyltransferase [Deefgea chitinilytica]MBM9889587.1 glycosyltransferase [Deefgea sp. CFH1-16]
MGKNVLVFRMVMPFKSEVFIREQAGNMSNFQVSYICRDLIGDFGGTVCSIPAEKKTQRYLFTLLRQSLLLKRFSEKKQASIIHAHFLPDAVMILPIAKQLGLPLIATSHGFDSQMSRCSQLKTLKPTNIQFLLHEQSLYREATSFIAVSNFIRGKMIDRGVAPEKIYTHYIGVDTKKFNLCDIEGRFVLNVSRHVKWKGIDVLLRAFAKTPQDWKLIQIGAGPETEALQQLTKELNIQDRVQWLGAQDHSEVIRLMRECAVYVQASLPDSNGQTEGFGMVLLEAAASGVPVIASRSGGMPEAMVENETGFLFEPGDAEELSLKLNHMLALDTYSRRAIGLAGRHFAETLDIRSQAIKLEKIYDETISKFKSR